MLFCGYILMKCCMVACINILYSGNRFRRRRRFAFQTIWSRFAKICRLIFPVEYVNTSYHTTFHQNISINMACIHKRALVPWKWQNAPPPSILPSLHIPSTALFIPFSILYFIASVTQAIQKMSKSSENQYLLNFSYTPDNFIWTFLAFARH